MTLPHSLRHRRPRDERGSALVITLMVMALITALATTVAVLTIDNLQSSWRAQQAGSAVNAADAGVSQAMSYLRTSGVSGLACSPDCGAANPWGDSTSPANATLPGSAGEGYQVWIEVDKAYPDFDPGKYVIHSTGTAAGAAARSVSVDVSVTHTDVPRGVFARSISGGGSAAVARESIFTTGCVYQRSKIHTNNSLASPDIDVAYGIPVGVHSSQYITESNGSGQYCPSSDKKLIHTPSDPCGAYPFDQDLLGGDLVGKPCESVQTAYDAYYGKHDIVGDSALDVDGSRISDDQTLFKLFNLKAPALSPAQLDQLKTIAQSQDNYFTSTSDWQSLGWPNPDEANAVMYFDLAEHDLGGTVNLDKITNFARAPVLDDASADCDHKSLVIVIDGGNASFNSHQSLVASLFLVAPAPNGQLYRANGTSDFIGTIYGDKVDLSGTANLSSDECFEANVSPALLDFQQGSYREEDRGLS